MALGHHRHRPASRRTGGSLVDRARRDESGAVLIVVALCLTVLVTAVAFTIDLGRVSTTRRDLQRTADVTALDLARKLEGRTTSAIVADAAFGVAFDRSLARNGFVAGGDKVATKRLGHWNAATEVFTVTTGPEIPDAVEVVLTDRVDYEFAPGGNTTSRKAVAANSTRASFSIGSYAARVDSSTSPLLQPLLGSILGVTAGGYGGLVGGKVALGPLLGELGLNIGSPADVMSTNVTLVQLLRAEAAVLRAGGDIARANLLDQTVLALPNPNATIPLGSLLTLGAGTDDGAAVAIIDAFDILTTAAFISNGDAFLTLPATAVNVGGLAGVTAKVKVIQKPGVVIGGVIGDTAATSQVEVALTVQSNVPGVADINLTVALNSASAVGTINSIGCGTTRTLGIGVQTGLVGVNAPITARVYLGPLPLADVALHASTTKPSGNYAVDFTIPPDAFNVPRQVTTAGIGLSGATVTVDTATLIGLLPLGQTLNGITSGLISGTITPLLGLLDSALLTPLLRALGTTVAGADVTPLEPLGCTGTKLVG
ncbi:hypothetical protein KSP35_00445 [Aquihabitans sp. G128]|uniref:pilus assembly protein TadG-related protein n=1 Tax=Aquihabitans sp. G128 TaxID=2849779 RepID=UPI001C240211|nr:pilus assembly protein TadG-related protein [Aquihabitans sp. G128]QXC61361.1 hypothetical protein KSP35_00445 [Aquihabitans sp. G128]